MITVDNYVSSLSSFIQWSHANKLADTDSVPNSFKQAMYFISRHQIHMIEAILNILPLQISRPSVMIGETRRDYGAKTL